MIVGFFAWIIFSVLIGVLAGSWGRSGFGWFVLALLVSPLLAVLALLIAGRYKGSSGSGSSYLHDREKKCPDCAERVKLEARVCKHCGHEWSEKEVRNQVLSEIRAFEGHLYYCTTSDEIVVPHGVMCPNCDGEIDDGDHPEAEEYFSHSY